MQTEEFLAWERASRDTIDFKTAYVDVAGDLVSGLLLSQIIYWHLPGENSPTCLLFALALAVLGACEAIQRSRIPHRATSRQQWPF